MEVVYDQWTIQQTYCTGTGMSVSGGTIPDSQLKFDASTTTELVYPQTATWQNWNIFFNNNDITNCPITLCTIYQNDCSTALSDATIVTVDSGSPFNVVAKKNSPGGYTL